MERRQLGKNGLAVSALGLGCAGMSGLYGAADRGECIATIQAAVDYGFNLLDTGDFYGVGHNELLIGEALRTLRREDVIVSVKAGALRDPAGGWNGYDSRPASLKNFLAYSLTRLGTDYIDVYRLSRLDPEIPIEETVGVIGEMVQAGYVRHIGLSEVGAQSIRRAAAVAPISDLQIEYSILSRNIEREILPVCRELGIGLTAYGVLSRGLISDRWRATDRPAQDDFRSIFPRFQADNLVRNLGLVDALKSIARVKGCSVAALAIAWVIAQGNDIIPLIGTSRRAHLADALSALDIRLSADDLAAIARAAPPGSVAGGRYPDAQLAQINSEQ